MCGYSLNRWVLNSDLKEDSVRVTDVFRKRVPEGWGSSGKSLMVWFLVLMGIRRLESVELRWLVGE